MPFKEILMRSGWMICVNSVNLSCKIYVLYISIKSTSLIRAILKITLHYINTFLYTLMKITVQYTNIQQYTTKSWPACTVALFVRATYCSAPYIYK